MSRTRRDRLSLPLLVIAITLTGCSSSSPFRPSPAVDVSGTWTGEETFTSITGGECLGPTLQEAIGLASQFEATLAQSGNTVTGVLDINHTGGVCDYEGTINGKALVIASVRCRETRADGITCSADAMRDLVLRTEALQATVNGNEIRGTAAETDDVFVSGTTILLNPLITVSSFVLTRK